MALWATSLVFRPRKENEAGRGRVTWIMVGRIRSATWRLPQGFLGGASEAGPSSPTTAAAPAHFRAACTEEVSPNFAAAHACQTSRLRKRTQVSILAGESRAQSLLPEARPEEVIAAVGPGASTPSGVAPPALHSL